MQRVRARRDGGAACGSAKAAGGRVRCREKERADDDGQIKMGRARSAARRDGDKMRGLGRFTATPGPRSAARLPSVPSSTHRRFVRVCCGCVFSSALWAFRGAASAMVGACCQRRRWRQSQRRRRWWAVRQCERGDGGGSGGGGGSSSSRVSHGSLLLLYSPRVRPPPAPPSQLALACCCPLLHSSMPWRRGTARHAVGVGVADGWRERPSRADTAASVSSAGLVPRASAAASSPVC